jgi:hypothetical protein
LSLSTGIEQQGIIKDLKPFRRMQDPRAIETFRKSLRLRANELHLQQILMLRLPLATVFTGIPVKVHFHYVTTDNVERSITTTNISTATSTIKRSSTTGEGRSSFPVIDAPFNGHEAPKLVLSPRPIDSSDMSSFLNLPTQESVIARIFDLTAGEDRNVRLLLSRFSAQGPKCPIEDWTLYDYLAQTYGSSPLDLEWLFEVPSRKEPAATVESPPAQWTQDLHRHSLFNEVHSSVASQGRF